MQDEKLSFEEALDRLERLIAGMEKGDLSLEESLRLFQEGMELIRHCRKLLADSEYRVEIILQDGEKGEYKAD
ncbi:MAG TPA: exodeoxyribonuclease VII small subunit [Firmicutes bacterium]|nr:exodeoxyribonuclease VII small subunit [Bacillota bacterium]